MAYFFKDEFEGAGYFEGHVPNVGFSEDNYWGDWSYPAALTLSDGYLVNSSYTGNKTASYGDADAGDNPPEFTLDMTFVTAPSVTPGEVYMGFSLYMTLDDAWPGDTLYVELSVQSGDWVLGFADSDDSQEVTITTLAADTEYELNITQTIDGTTLTFLGQTMTLATPHACEFGVKAFELQLGDGCKIGRLAGASAGAAPDEGGTGSAELTAPMAALSASGAPGAEGEGGWPAGIFFQDKFDGSGSITGHVPDVEIGTGAAWEEKVRTTNLVGGYAVNPASYGACLFGYSSLDSDDSPGEFTVGFTFVMGPSIDIEEADSYGFILVIYLDKGNPFTRVTLAFTVDYDIGEWVLDLRDDEHFSGGEIIYPEPDTEYEGSITVSNTGVTATMFGATIALSNPLPVPGGVRGFDVTLGGGCKFGSLMGMTIGYEPPLPGVGDAALVAPMAELRAGDGAKAAAQLTAPMAVLRAASGGAAKLLAPAAVLEATGHDAGGQNAFAYMAPAPMLKAFGGASARLAAPRPALALTGTVSGQGRAALAPPAPLIVVNGRVSGTAAAALRAPMATLVGYAGAVCSIRAGGATIQASGTAGAVGRAALVLPLFELVASGARQNHGGGELLAPSARLGATAQAWLMAPGARLAAIGTAVVGVEYEAYSINLSHRDPEAVDETTRYTNFPFERIVRFQGSYFGVALDGLYLLEGTTDDGAPIAYEVKTCLDDFQAPQLKTLVSAYLSGRLGPAATVTLFAGEAGAQSYAYDTPRGAAARNHRQKFGRGVKDRYFALGLAGEDALALDAIEPEILTLTRRI